MLEMIAGLAFLSTIAILGLAIYARGRKYEETKRLEGITACREDDLEWSVKYTTAAYAAKNNFGAE